METTVLMEQALAQAAGQFGLKIIGPAVLGLENKSISAKVQTAEGEEQWLKVSRIFPGRAAPAPLHLGPMFGQPAIMAAEEIELENKKFRVEAMEYIEAPVVSASPILPGDVILPDDWFTSLREILELLAATLPTQTTFNAPAASQKIRAVFGSNTPTMPPAHLATVHGDLHWSNLTAFPLYIFDWEHCGAGLPAYDPAMLLMLALGNKKVSAQIEQYFDDWLQKTDGLWAQVYAAAEIMSRYSADPNFPALKPLLDQRVRSILPRLARRG